MRTRPVVLAVVAALVALTAGRGAATSRQSDPKFEELAGLVTRKMAEYGVPGVAVGIVKSGQCTMRGFGVTNVEYPQPIGPDTVFPIASISKTFATTAMMRLVEQGKVDLNAPVRKYLPHFRVQDRSAETTSG